MNSAIKTRLPQILAVSACLLTAPVAVAQGDKGDGADWVPVKHLTFTPDDVEGGVSGPEGELIEIVQRASQPSLIELREGFEAEVVKTMENM
jgi:hypothetical protein